MKIADLEIPSYENIIKATIKHSDAVIVVKTCLQV
jgi:hypothetical protein